jgi:hypothetical protein
LCYLVLGRRDSIGDSAIAGDLRWAGSYGVNVDFVARSHCAVEVILLEDMQVNAELFTERETNQVGAESMKLQEE